MHLIYHEYLRYEWTVDIPAFYTDDFTLANYRALTTGLGIIGTVYMESAVDDADYVAEARMIAGLMSGATSGISGQIASCRPETSEGFLDWLEEAAALGAVGFRRVLHVMPDGLSQTETFRTNLREIGKRGLPFDLCVLARQLPIAIDLAQACDDQLFVLDHCGVPDIAGGKFSSWATDIDRLAKLPNICVKLSGITAYCAPGQVNTRILQPWVDHVIQSFGPCRILWGSDWPVVDLGVGLTEWISLTQQLLAGLSSDEAAQVSSGTARRVYSLPAEPVSVAL